MTRTPLKCPGVGRDKDCISALEFYFSRPVTDDEMRFLHDVMQRAAACVPATTCLHIVKVTEESCPGHIASESDPKVCDRCGTHIDSLRPPDEENCGRSV
jgi:hypothetical protein